MIIDNSFRLFTTQSKLVWKVLLYQIIYVVLIAGITVACCYSLIDAFVNNGFIESTKNVIVGNMFNLRIDELLQDISQSLDTFWQIVTQSTSNTISAVVLFFVVFVVGNFLFHFMSIPMSEVIYGFMGSSARLSFVGCFFSNFGRSVRYALCRLVTSLPVDVAIFAVFVLMLKFLPFSGIMAFVSSFVLVLALIVLISFRMTLFGLWTPSIVVQNRGIWKAFGTSVKVSFKNFRTVFPTYLLAVLIVLAVNLAFAIFTCGVGCIISVPASVVFSVILANVLYFHFSGLRYYIDKSRIICPKKIDDQEHLRDVKFIV